MVNIYELQMHEEKNVNETTKVFRVEKGVIWKFHNDNKVTSCCLIEIEKRKFLDSKPKGLSDIH